MRDMKKRLSLSLTLSNGKLTFKNYDIVAMNEMPS